MKYTSQVPVQRMKKSADFKAMPRGQALHYRGFVLAYDLNKTSEVKIGFTASKKVGNAVKRSRAKRLMRAITDDVMRLNPQFSCEGGHFVLIARKHIFDCEYEKMKKDLRAGLDELGVSHA